MKAKRLSTSTAILLLTLYKALHCLFLFVSSHGPRSVKPMPFTTTTSATPMSLATRRPRSSGSNLCKQIIKKQKKKIETLDLPHSVYYSIHLYSTTSTSSSRVVLYTNTRLRRTLVHTNAHHNANLTTLKYNTLCSSLNYFFFFYMFKQCLIQVSIHWGQEL